MFTRLLACFLALLCLRAHGAAAQKPNFIFILVDDLGATDLGCTGSKFYETPHLDRLAKDGMRFTQAYSACTVCSPTRASLLTGKSPAALHLTDWIAGHKAPFAKLRVPDWNMQLPKAEVTLAERLREAGYATGIVGKWHLGQDDPSEHGFDFVFAQMGGSPRSYFSPYNTPKVPDGPAGEFLSDRLTAEAERFIEQNKERPFFLYLPHAAVHTPIQAKKDVIEKYRRKMEAAGGEAQGQPAYAALVESVDDSIGRLRAKLESLGLNERTVIVFTSDNGGLIGNQQRPITTNLGLRVGKGSAYEGGVRVPLLVHWPKVTKADSTSAVPVITADFYPTFCDIAGLGAKAPAEEFRSLTPILRGNEEIEPRPLYWHYPHYHPGGATPYGAIRDGDWRLVEFFEDDRVELYNLRSDPAESRNLAAEQRAKTGELLGKLRAWREKTGAQLPSPNPEHDPAKDRPRAGRGNNAPASAK
jgi:arylsulfatase A